MNFPKDVKVFSFLGLSLILTFISQFALSLDLRSAEEARCFQIHNQAYIDLKWMWSVKKWYFVKMSRYELYMTAADLLQKHPNQLNEDDLYYDSCITYTISRGDNGEQIYTANGFGKESRYSAYPVDETERTVTFKTDHGDEVRATTASGISHVTLTDNSTFIVYIMCRENMNQMGWEVGSPYASLKPETVRLIHDHVESLGFKKEQFTGLRFNQCKGEEED